MAAIPPLARPARIPPPLGETPTPFRSDPVGRASPSPPPYTVPDPSPEVEARQCARRSLHCEMFLVDNVMEDSAGIVVIPGMCLNVSDGGLFGTVPLGFGVAMGQRYTVRLKIGERGPEPGSLKLVSQQGRIVRAELMFGPDGYADRAGIALRLYGHRDGMLPLPVRT